MEAEIKGSIRPEAEEVSNSGRLLSVDIYFKRLIKASGSPMWRVANHLAISRIVQNKSIFNFYTKTPCG